jgi:hypothetical protein
LIIDIFGISPLLFRLIAAIIRHYFRHCFSELPEAAATPFCDIFAYFTAPGLLISAISPLRRFRQLRQMFSPR